MGADRRSLVRAASGPAEPVSSVPSREKDLPILGAFHHEDAQGPLVDGPRDGVVHQDVVPWDLNPELHRGRSSGGYQGRLDALLRRRDKVTLQVYSVEDLPNDVEGGDEVGSCHAEEDAHRLPSVRLEGMVAS